MRFSTLIAFTLVIYIAVVSAIPEHSFEYPSPVANGQSVHLMARGKKKPGLLSGILGGLFGPLGKKTKGKSKTVKPVDNSPPSPPPPPPPAPAPAPAPGSAPGSALRKRRLPLPIRR